MIYLEPVESVQVESNKPIEAETAAVIKEVDEVKEDENQEEKPESLVVKPEEDVEVMEDPKAYLKEQAKRRRGAQHNELADDFYYDYDSLIFKPVISEESNQPHDLLKLL